LCLSPRSISTAQLQQLLAFHMRPINPVVYREPYLRRIGVGDLILELASRLDAFSAYRIQT